MAKRIKAREYVTRKGAERHMAKLQEQFPDRRFYVAPTQSFKFAVFTSRDVTLPDDPNNTGVICA